MKYTAAILRFIFVLGSAVQAWEPAWYFWPQQNHRPHVKRRNFFHQSMAPLAVTTWIATMRSPIARAETLSSKELVLVELDVVPTGRFPMAVNGVVQQQSSSPKESTQAIKGTRALLSYRLPLNWNSRQNYSDATILTYQKTGTAQYEGLEKAARGSWKVARALDIGDRFPAAPGLKQRLDQAAVELVTDSTVTAQNGNDDSTPRNVDFDLTNVSETATTFYYIRATILNSRLYVFLLEYVTGNDDQHVARGVREEMRQIRSSFRVEKM